MKNVLKRVKNYSVDDFKRLKITSNAFKFGESIPPQYTCEGKNYNPPLDIEFIPEKAKCLAIMVVDFDAPLKPWIHWMVWNVPVTHHIKENFNIGISGINDFANFNYIGPCPNKQEHHYFFKIYALDTLLELSSSATSVQMEKAMSEHILGFGEIMGTYKRIRN